MATTVTPKCIGRKRESAVWEYFAYDSKERWSSCIKCGALIRGNFTTNLKSHLKAHHALEYAMFAVREKEQLQKKELNMKMLINYSASSPSNCICVKKEPSTSSSSATSSSEICPHHHHNHHHHHPHPQHHHPIRQNKIVACSSSSSSSSSSNAVPYAPKNWNRVTKKLSLFVATSGESTSIVNNEEFRELLFELDPFYEIPNRSIVEGEMNGLYLTTKINLRTIFEECLLLHSCSNPSRFKMAVTSDIWRSKGHSASDSYLAVSAHFFHERSMHKMNVFLGLKPMSHPHNGEKIHDVIMSVLTDWNVPSDRVSRIVTDNGSYVVATFKNTKHYATSNEDWTTINSNTDEFVKIEVTGSDYEEVDKDATAQEDDSHVQMDCSNTVIAESSEFAERENELDRVFSRNGHLRITCFAHILQCVVRCCDSMQFHGPAVRRLNRLIGRLTRSSRAMTILSSRTKEFGKSLIGDVCSGWSGTFLVVHRALELRDVMMQTCAELNWNGLHEEDWNSLCEYKNFYEPFAKYTELLRGSDEVMTLSCVVPVLLELFSHLYATDIQSGISPISMQIRKLMHDTFDKWLLPSHAEFDPLFVTATFLDPCYRLILDANQVTAAKACILQSLRPNVERMAQDSHQEVVMDALRPGSSSSSISSSSEQPLSKRFKYIPSIIRQKMENMQNVAAVDTGKEVMELEAYCNQETSGEEMDAIAFWLEHRERYTSLWLYACQLFSIPASSAPSEQDQSYDLMNKKDLQKRVFLKRNKHLLSAL